MNILEAYDLTGSLRDAAELAGCSHHTVARYVAAREQGRLAPGAPARRPGVIDGFLHAIGDVVTEAGTVVRRLQGGFVRGYAAIILLGALAVIGFFAYFGVYALRMLP